MQSLVEVATILAPGAVCVLGGSSGKKQLFQTMAQVAARTYGVNRAQAVEALWRREALGTTGIGGGVALPHGQIQGLTKIVGTFLLLLKPCDFDAVDRRPIDMAFTLFTPENSETEHLRALALVARTLSDRALRQKLRANPDAAMLYTILTNAPHIEAA